ncbi:MAG: hypothetical protein HW391_2051 [Chloroflexi bacterium]|nr:hypothetical protein [Chloroflexota bacterium]
MTSPKPEPSDGPSAGSSEPPSSVREISYKGAPLDAEKGPGLGCFWSQIVVLVGLLVLTPLSVVWGWPEWASTALLITVLVLLLVAGQTIIFLLRLVAADRRAAGRRRPLASATRTVGELEDEAERPALATSGDEQSRSSGGGVRE